MKFLAAMKYQIHLQQFLLIAPFHVVNGRVEPSTLLTFYLLGSVVSYVANILIAISLVRTDGSLRLLHFENGYLWAIIVAFELIFATVSYPILIVHTLLNRRHHINFLNTISDIDERLADEFGVDTDSVNSGKRCRSYFFIVTSTLYFWSLWYLVFFHVLPPAYVTKKGLMLLLLANQAEQGSMGLLTLTIINHCTFIRMRFRMLQSIDMAAVLGLADVQRRRRLTGSWLTMFRDLCGLIEKMNRGWGFVIAWRYSHDFTLLISQLYLMYWIFDRSGALMKMAFIAYWAMQNVVKLVGLGLSATLATRKVNIYVVDFKRGTNQLTTSKRHTIALQ